MLSICKDGYENYSFKINDKPARDQWVKSLDHIENKSVFTPIIVEKENDLEGQSQWPSLSIPAESIPWCMFGENLVIPAQICAELLCRQGKV